MHLDVQTPSADLLSGDPVTVYDLLAGLRGGYFAVPSGKHVFDWDVHRIGAVAEMIFRGRPLPDLIFFSADEESGHCADAIVDHPLCRPKIAVRQGHIRLTALHYAFCAPDLVLPDSPYRQFRALFFIRLDKPVPENDDMVEHVLVVPGAGRGYAGAISYFGSTERQFRDHIFPLSVIGEGAPAVENWFTSYRKYWDFLASDYNMMCEKTVLDYKERLPETDSLIERIIAMGELQSRNIVLTRSIERGLISLSYSQPSTATLHHTFR